MTDEQYIAFVAQREADANRDPVGYRRHVVLLALLGYGFIAAVLLGLIGVIASLYLLSTSQAVLLFKLTLPVFVLIGVIFRSLWIRTHAPAGRHVTASEAPELFRMIDDVRAQVQAPRIHHVLMVGAESSAVVQIQRFGVFGPTANYVLISLPLLYVATAEQFKCVLAHELGHLSTGDNRVGAFIYRIRETWHRLTGDLEQHRRWGAGLFRRFFKWYSPYFDAYSFPLRLAEEHRADQVAVRVTSPRAAAEVMTVSIVAYRFIADVFWPQVERRMMDSPDPDIAPYAAMPAQLTTGVGEPITETWIADALAHKRGLFDTHPSPAERFAAYGEPPRLALPESGKTAFTLLGASGAVITADLDREWQSGVTPYWRQRHNEVRTDRQRLAAIEQKLAETGALEITEAFERATLIETVGAGAEAAFDLFHHVTSHAPDNPIYALALGRRLLEVRDDESGIALIERAMRDNEDSVTEGCVVIGAFHRKHGRLEEAGRWDARVRERVQLLMDADRERAAAYPSDTFDPHGLPDATIATLRARLTRIPNVRKVYIVRKRLQHLVHRPLYIVGYAVTPWWLPENRRMRQEAFQPVANAVIDMGDVIVVGIEAAPEFGKKFVKVAGARIV